MPRPDDPRELDVADVDRPARRPRGRRDRGRGRRPVPVEGQHPAARDRPPISCPNFSVSRRFLTPSGRMARPNPISKALTDVVQTDSAGTPSSQRTTSASGTSRISAESTFVSRMISFGRSASKSTARGAWPVSAPGSRSTPSPAKRAAIRLPSPGRRPPSSRTAFAGCRASSSVLRPCRRARACNRRFTSSSRFARSSGHDDLVISRLRGRINPPSPP